MNNSSKFKPIMSEQDVQLCYLGIYHNLISYELYINRSQYGCAIFRFNNGEWEKRLLDDTWRPVQDETRIIFTKVRDNMINLHREVDYAKFAQLRGMEYAVLSKICEHDPVFKDVLPIIEHYQFGLFVPRESLPEITLHSSDIANLLCNGQSQIDVTELCVDGNHISGIDCDTRTNACIIEDDNYNVYLNGIKLVRCQYESDELYYYSFIYDIIISIKMCEISCSSGKKLNVTDNEIENTNVNIV